MSIFNLRIQTDGTTLTVLSVTPETTPVPNPKILGFIGDSNTATRTANGITQALTFSELVRAARGFDTVVNAGIGGQTSAQMLARFQTDIINAGVDHVCIDGGINGVMAGQTAVQYESDLRAMVQMAVTSGLSVTLSTPWMVKTTAYINAMDPFVEKVRLVAADFNIPLVDVYEELLHFAWVTGNGADFYAKYLDDQHQNVAGHAWRAGLYSKPYNWRACKLPS